MAASGGMGLPEGCEIRAVSRDSKERIDGVPRVAERAAGLLLGSGGVRLRIGMTKRDTIGLARGFIRAGVDAVGTGKTTRDGSDMGRRGDRCHDIYDLRIYNVRFCSIKSHRNI